MPLLRDPHGLGTYSQVHYSLRSISAIVPRVGVFGQTCGGKLFDRISGSHHDHRVASFAELLKPQATLSIASGVVADFRSARRRLDELFNPRLSWIHSHLGTRSPDHYNPSLHLLKHGSVFQPQDRIRIPTSAPTLAMIALTLRRAGSRIQASTHSWPHALSAVNSSRHSREARVAQRPAVDHTLPLRMHISPAGQEMWHSWTLTWFLRAQTGTEREIVGSRPSKTRTIRLLPLLQ